MDTTGGQSKTSQTTSGSVLSLQLSISIDKMITFVVVVQNKFFCGKLLFLLSNLKKMIIISIYKVNQYVKQKVGNQKHQG